MIDQLEHELGGVHLHHDDRLEPRCEPAVWTAPRTYVAGEVVTATILNLDHRDNLLAITGSVRATRTTTQSTQPFDVSFDTEVVDDFAGWAIGVPTKLFVPGAGRFDVRWWLRTTGGTDGWSAAWVKRFNSGDVLQEDNIAGGGIPWATAGQNMSGTARAIVCAAGDYFVLRYASAASGTTANVARADLVISRDRA